MTPEERARTIAYLDLAEGRGSVPLLDDAGVRELLGSARRIAVIGASDRPGRASYDVFRHLLGIGFDCVPVNPKVAEIAGVRAFPTLAEALEAARPTVLVGVSGAAGAFTPAILRRMAELNTRPVVFALSNPTSRAECTAEQAYRETDGRVLFAGGSPFAPVEFGGRVFRPGQGNNVYVFPGVGFGALACGAREVTDAMFLAAARRLAGLVTDAELAEGRVYPALTRIREVSLELAIAVVAEARRAGLATIPLPDDPRAELEARRYEAVYRDFV